MLMETSLLEEINGVLVGLYLGPTKTGCYENDELGPYISHFLSHPVIFSIHAPITAMPSAMRPSPETKKMGLKDGPILGLQPLKLSAKETSLHRTQP
jgi:hypothetical protein